MVSTEPDSHLVLIVGLDAANSGDDKTDDDNRVSSGDDNMEGESVLYNTNFYG